MYYPLSGSSPNLSSFKMLLKCQNVAVQTTELAKKVVLGCVIPPAGAVVRSRNLRQTFMANSVHKLD